MYWKGTREEVRGGHERVYGEVRGGHARRVKGEECARASNRQGKGRGVC